MDNNTSNKTITAFRPRLLYCTIFIWNTLTVGKFTAPLLQHLSPNNFTDGIIGLTFALQYGIAGCVSTWGGSYADAQEKKASRWGYGRIKVLTLFLTLGTLSFLGHGIPHYMNLPTDTTAVLAWHVAMRCIYAVSLGVVAPTLDGLALAHLDCAENSSSVDFGKERMYGALCWGLGSFIAGVGIDQYGFNFLYIFLIVSTITSYAGMGIYLWGLSRDTSGNFKKYSVIFDEASSSNNNGYQNEEPNKEKDEDISNYELMCMICKTNYAKAIMLFTFLLAMGIAVVDNLAFIFFETLGASDAMDGLTVVFTVAVEVPAFSIAPLMLQRYGCGRMLLGAGIAYVIRVVGYTLIPYGKMYIVLMLELLHGVSYAGSKAGSVEFISRSIPEGHEAAGQGILMFVTYSGIVAGLIVAGWIQETLGARYMFRVMAVIVSIGLIVLLLAEILCDKDTIRPSKKEEEGQMTHSDSCQSSASAFADEETEKFLRTLKYDSLGKVSSNFCLNMTLLVYTVTDDNN